MCTYGDFRQHAIPVTIMCMLRGTPCYTGIYYTFYRGNICSVVFHHAYVCIQFLYSLPSQFVQIFMKSQCNFQTISQDFFSCHILHGKSCENAGGYKLRPDFRLPLTQACTNFIRVSLIWKILEFQNSVSPT